MGFASVTAGIVEWTAPEETSLCATMGETMQMAVMVVLLVGVGLVARYSKLALTCVNGMANVYLVANAYAIEGGAGWIVACRMSLSDTFVMRPPVCVCALLVTLGQNVHESTSYLVPTIAQAMVYASGTAVHATVTAVTEVRTAVRECVPWLMQATAQ